MLVLPVAGYNPESIVCLCLGKTGGKNCLPSSPPVPSPPQKKALRRVLVHDFPLEGLPSFRVMSYFTHIVHRFIDEGNDTCSELEMPSPTDMLTDSFSKSGMRTTAPPLSSSKRVTPSDHISAAKPISPQKKRK